MFHLTPKHLFGLLLVILALTAQHGFAALFEDGTGTPYAAALEQLGQEGVIHGYDDGLVHPEWPINRAEALKVIVNVDQNLMAQAQRFQMRMPVLPLFADVSQTSWYAPFVEVAFRQGIASGYPDGTLRPSRRLSTEEAITLVERSFGIQSAGSPYRSSESAPNIPGQWFTDAWSTAIDRGMVLATPSIVPGQVISRGYFFHLVFRARQLRGQQIVQAPAVNAPPPVISQPVVPVVPVDGTDPAAIVYASDKPFAISIPALGISDIEITHPDDLSSKGLLTVLRSGLGHLFSYPGDGGKVLIYGHSSGYPWDISQYTKVFRTINKLKPGQRIYLTYNGRLHVYEVSKKEVVPAKDTGAFEPDGNGEDLILYTCWPPDSISNRYLVHASPVSTVSLQ